MAARGVSTAGQAVLMVGIAHRDLCVTPCTFEMKPGIAELGVHGYGVSGQTLKLDFQSGPQRLRVNPGSSGLAVGGGILLTAGITTAVVGVVFMALSDDIMSFEALPLTLIGTGVVLSGRA